MDPTVFITLAVITVAVVLWLLVAVEAVKREHWGWLVAMVLLGPPVSLLYWLVKSGERPREDALPMRRGEYSSDRDYRR